MTMLSNKLADLAERVKEAKDAVLVAQRTTVEKAFEAGRLLIEAKAEAKHGEWLPFLQRAGVAERSAQRFMTLAGSGLEIRHVSDLGGLKAALAFLSQWRLPTFDETMVIADPERPQGESAGRGAAFIWEDHQHRGHFHVGMINSFDGDEGLVHTKKPMLPMLECEGDRPIDTIIHFLTLHFTLPISEWRIGFIPREPKMSLVLAPFWKDDTFREPEAARRSA